MKTKLIQTINAVIFSSFFMLISCGGGEEQKTEGTGDTSKKAPVEVVKPKEGEIIIKVTGNSMADMAYDPTSLTVKSGQKIKLTLINENKAEGMSHNWVLVPLGKGQEVVDAGLKAGADKGYVPESPAVLAHTALAGPEQTVSVEFTAPAPGSYNYICTYPGHFPKMIGKLIVE